MDEYIERGVAIREIEQINPVDYGAMWDYEAHNWTGKCLRDCKEAIDSISAADVAPVVRGRWEQVKKWATKAKYRCSVCGREIMSAVKVNIEKYPYCHCGAKMDGCDNTER